MTRLGHDVKEKASTKDSRDDLTNPCSQLTPQGQGCQVALGHRRKLAKGAGRILPFAMLTGVAVGFGAVLVVTSFLGLFVRPTSDDYCAAAKTRLLGVLGLVHHYYFDVNGRVANALASGVVYTDGGFLTKLLPAVLLGTLAVATAGTTALVLRRVTDIGHGICVAAGAAVGTTIAAVACWGSPNPYQVILWAPGSISHTLPSVVAILFVFAAVTARGKHTTAVCLAGFLLGAAVATLSEAFAVTSGTLTATFLLFQVARRDRHSPHVRIAVAVGLGIATGLLLVVTSPGAAARRASLRGTSLTLEDSLRLAAQVYGKVTSTSFNGYFLSSTLLVGVLLAVLLGPPRVSWRTRVSVFMTGLSLPLIMAFEVVLVLESGYGVGGWLFVRAWEDFLILSALLLVVVGYVASSQFVSLLTRSNPGALCIVALVPIFFLGTAVSSYLFAARAMTATVVQRAVAWDAQAAKIRASSARGEESAVYRVLPIASLAEPLRLPRDHDWVGQCAAQYFRVREVRPPAGSRSRKTQSDALTRVRAPVARASSLGVVK